MKLSSILWFSNPRIDSDLLIPYYASPIGDSKRDFSFHFRVFHSKLYKHGQSLAATTLDKGERPSCTIVHDRKSMLGVS